MGKKYSDLQSFSLLIVFVLGEKYLSRLLSQSAFWPSMNLIAGKCWSHMLLYKSSLDIYFHFFAQKLNTTTVLPQENSKLCTNYELNLLFKTELNSQPSKQTFNAPYTKTSLVGDLEEYDQNVLYLTSYMYGNNFVIIDDKYIHQTNISRN